MEIEALGPVNPRQIPEFIEQVEAEGNYFVPTPPLRANWPLRTDDLASQVPPEDHDDDDGCADGS